jgi:hypothetical protein
MRLLKQSPALFTVDSARAALAAQPSVKPQAPSPQSLLSAEREYVARLKRLSIALLGHASAAYGDVLKDQQEVLAQIADVIIETYATESGIARAEKMSGRNEGRASLAIDIARVYTHEAADRVAAAAKQVVMALTARGADAALGVDVQRLASYPGIDAIAARRRIADAVIEAGRYPL